MFNVSEALKEAKVTCQNAEAALTRAGKSLWQTIKIRCPATEVKKSLSEVKEAYEKLTQEHEQLKKLMEDDEKFEKEEMWFEECQEMFMQVEVQAKEYIDATETEKSIWVTMKEDISNNVVESYPGLTSPSQINSGMIGVQSFGNQFINTSASNPSVWVFKKTIKILLLIRVALKWRNQKYLNSPETLESTQYLTQTLNTQMNWRTARAMPSVFFTHVSKANH